jgi:hypothetical protein
VFLGERLELVDHSDFRIPTSDFEIGQPSVVRGQLLMEWTGIRQDDHVADSLSPFRLPISDFRIPTSSGSPLSNHTRPSTLDAGPYSDFRLPTSDFEIDAFFARLDDGTVALTGGVYDEDDRAEKPDNEAEDGLDLWSLLYGLK